MATTASSLPPILSTTSTTTTTATSQNQHIPIIPIHKPKPGSIKSCKNFRQIQQLHAHFTKQGLIQNPTALTNLIVKYAEMGISESLQHAQKAFEIIESLEEREKLKSSNYIYNSLIKGYTKAGLFDEAILIYVQMVIEGVEFDNYTFPFVLSACAKSLRLLEGVQLHGSIVKWGFDNDVFVLNSLIHFYGECGQVEKGKKVFDKMCERNVVSWTSLIGGYAQVDQPKEAVRLFFEMVEEGGIVPNEVSLVTVISVCAKLGDLELAERVCGYVGESGVKVNTVMVNALVDVYMKCGAVDRAKRLFDECDERNLVLYNTVMSNYVRQGMEREALDVLTEMLQQGPRPDRVTMLSAISAFAELGDSCYGRQCHGYVLRNGLGRWETINNALIDMYMKCGKKESACSVFDRMSDKTVVSWNSMIAGFVRNGDVESAWVLFNEMPESDLVSWNTIISGLVQESLFEDAIRVFQVMQNEGIRADKVTMVSVASACGYLGALDLAKWTYNYIKKYGIHCDMKLCTALIDMFARCGDPQSAMRVFNGMKERDVSAWTATIGAMAMEGNGERAVELFYEMLREGVKPDEVVFTGVLTACSHGGLVDQGRQIFRSMEETYGITPQVVHYGCLVDLLGRAGLLDEALDLIKTMAIEPNDAIWGALLAACRIHKNDKLAAYAAEMLTESTQDKSGIHVLLSNIYASAGKWSDVAKVRMQMKEKGIKKMPGSSSIEVNGTVHEFTSGDESHPDKTSIAVMLDEMNCRLRDGGHVPDLSNVLLDIDEQEKEILLSRHSEKQAIAFGLISTSKGTPIRVVKNLRMCSDCHSFARLVSKVYNRDIVVRDNNRFHFFHEGFCSCGDYW